MTRAKTIPPKLFGARDVHLDALHCGSTIGYRCGLSRYKVLSMGVRLTDCHKQIIREFDDYTPGSVEKIDTAIAMMREARALWVKELAAHKKRFGRKKKK